MFKKQEEERLEVKDIENITNEDFKLEVKKEAKMDIESNLVEIIVVDIKSIYSIIIENILLLNT